MEGSTQGGCRNPKGATNLDHRHREAILCMGLVCGRTSNAKSLASGRPQRHRRLYLWIGKRLYLWIGRYDWGWIGTYRHTCIMRGVMRGFHYANPVSTAR